MKQVIGKKIWAIAEGYIPSQSTGKGPAFESHETACIINTNDTPAEIEIVIYFSDKEPVGPYKITVDPERTLHLRFNSLTDPMPIPRDTDYASIFVSNVPVVVQHTRLDSRQAENALLSTIAYSES